jgi:hypothetical protein
MTSQFGIVLHTPVRDDDTLQVPEQYAALRYDFFMPNTIITPLHSNALINAKHAACKYSVWIDLAKAKRRREKKTIITPLHDAFTN